MNDIADEFIAVMHQNVDPTTNTVKGTYLFKRKFKVHFIILIFKFHTHKKSKKKNILHEKSLQFTILKDIYSN